MRARHRQGRRPLTQERPNRSKAFWLALAGTLMLEGLGSVVEGTVPPTPIVLAPLPWKELIK